MDNTLFGDAANTFKMKVEQEGGLFGYLQSLPNKIVSGLQDLPDKIANKTSELWQKFQDSEFGKKFMESAKNIISSFTKDTAEYAERKAQGTLKYLFKNTRFDFDELERKKREREARSAGPIALLPEHAESVTTDSGDNEPTPPDNNPPIISDAVMNTIPDDAKPEGSYKGGLVNKSGMVSVSKGELIVPAKLQYPYVHIYNL